MASLVQSGKHGDINTTYTLTMEYYVLKFVSEAYNLQDDAAFDELISSVGELVGKVQYL